MLRSGIAFGALVAVVAAGCTTGAGHRKSARAPDWQSEELNAQPTAAAKIAPPPLALKSTLVAPTGPRTNEPHNTWQSLNRWGQKRGAPPPSHISNGQFPAYSISVSNRMFVLQSGRNVASCNGLEIRLGFEPQMIDGQLFVHSLDLEKNLEPLLGDTLLVTCKTHGVIVIDPGHGGEDSGTRTVSGSRYEKEYTLDWAKRVGSLLASNGWEVWLTRTNDMDIALSNRVLFAEARKADLFLSLHFNSSSPDHAQSGLETYCLTPCGMRSTVTRGFSDDSTLSFANNSFDSQNMVLAYRVHCALVQSSGAQDRGVRRARFPGVLRNQQRPSILVEGGYLSNLREAERIADPAYRQKLAEAVARALSSEWSSSDRVTPVASAVIDGVSQGSDASTGRATTAMP